MCLPDGSCGSSFFLLFWATKASKVHMNGPLLCIIEMVVDDIIKKLIESAFFGWQKSYLIDQDWILDGRNNPGQSGFIFEHLGA